MAPEESERLRRSWDANASAWRDAVRERKIASRRAGTDAAVVDVIAGLQPRTVLDLGCGEGWLSRTLAARGIEVAGVDGSAALIDAAKELGGGAFHAASYESLARGEVLPGRTFDVAVANFAILDEDVAPILSAARRLLRDEGSLVIQTVHPAFAEPPYRSGWRTETFAAIEGDWSEPMPWYSRTLSSWVEALRAHGYRIDGLREPLGADGERPLSIIFICRR